MFDNTFYGRSGEIWRYDYDYRDCDYFIKPSMSSTHYSECLKNPYNYAHYFIYYTVTFYSNSSVVSSQSIRRGQNATTPTTPTRAGFVFGGWDKSFSNLQSNLMVYAIWNPINFDVTFVDYNGSTLLIDNILPGEVPTPPNDPSREGYRFTGWSVPLNNIQQTTTVQAQYIKLWNVIFKDANNETISEEILDEGQDAIAPTDPTREGYTFNGWGQSLQNITSDRVFEPQWLKNLNISFLDKSGQVFSSTVIPETYNVNPPNPPTEEGYMFKEWSHSLNNLTEDTVFEAIYERAYNVRFLDENENILKEEMFFQNTHAIPPVITHKPGMAFVGWDKDIRNLKEDLIVHPIYRPRGLSGMVAGGAKGLIDSNTNQNYSIWTGTLSEYNNLTHSPNTIYFIRDGNNIPTIKIH